MSDSHDPYNALAQFALDDTFPKLNINGDANELYIIRHLRPMTVNGIKYEVLTTLF